MASPSGTGGTAAMLVEFHGAVAHPDTDLLWLRDTLHRSPAEPTGARAQLAGFWNSWFYRHELEKAHAFANDHSEEECREELSRLNAVRDGRIEEWRWTQ